MRNRSMSSYRYAFVLMHRSRAFAYDVVMCNIASTLTQKVRALKKEAQAQAQNPEDEEYEDEPY